MDSLLNLVLNKDIVMSMKWIAVGVFLAVSLSVNADIESLGSTGDWMVSHNKDKSVNAISFSSSGVAINYKCFSGKYLCTMDLLTQLQCVQGQRIYIAAFTESQVITREASCEPTGKFSRLNILYPDPLKQMLISSEKLRILLLLNQNNIPISDFKVSGFTQAVRKVESSTYSIK